MADQAVNLSFEIDSEEGISDSQFDTLLALEQAIVKRLAADAPESDYDGHEVPIEGSGDARLFIYGPSAEKIADVVLPLVRRYWPEGRAAITTHSGEDRENGIAREIHAVE